MKAKDIEEGECFRKKNGSFGYIRISESSIKFYKLDSNLVYGITSNGNMTAVDPEKDVDKVPLDTFFEAENQGKEVNRNNVWPDVSPPPMYENPCEGWEDPELPDFRMIWQVARQVGYAVGIHGSLKRDVDLIAAPWSSESQSPEVLIDYLCSALRATQIGGVEFKPQGRMAVTLQIDSYCKQIDLSIMPRVE